MALSLLLSLSDFSGFDCLNLTICLNCLICLRTVLSFLFVLSVLSDCVRVCRCRCQCQCRCRCLFLFFCLWVLFRGLSFLQYLGPDGVMKISTTEMTTLNEQNGALPTPQQNNWDTLWINKPESERKQLSKAMT